MAAETSIIISKPWRKKSPPRRILAIRLQAMGDTIITMPYLLALKKSLPANTRLDFLTREEVADIPKNLKLFNKVYCLKGGRDFKRQYLFACLLLTKLFLNRYNIVIDLQNNPLSRLVRKCMMPAAWSEFDRFSPLPAGERTCMTIEAIGLGENFIDTQLVLKTAHRTDEILKENGWDGESGLVVLNPAGAFATRNWGLDNYVAFANLWLARFPSTQFVIPGTIVIAEQAAYIKQLLGSSLINLVGKTSAAQAFAIIQKAQFVLSEDSGLMHMAWVSGVPTIALFGSTRSDWSRPLGENSLLLCSDDLPCGNCMLAICKYGDVHCLTRYTARFVMEKIAAFLQLETPVQKLKGGGLP
ncbi:MAG TPA: glycosyltransferase family 9 protein [Chitinophagaceae bacterium]|nr:glycosyltransferase family 9 protein [Chitinophagaceae bacterium]